MPSSFASRKTKRLRKRRTWRFGRLAKATYSVDACASLSRVCVYFRACSIGTASADDARMSETPVPETLETIAAKIDALSKSVDQRFEETRAQLGVKIEAVDAKVVKVYDEVIAMREESKRNATEHKTFTKRLDNHDVRILALENPDPAKS